LVSVDKEAIAATSQVPAESVVLVLQGSSPDAHPGIVDGYERLRRQGVVSAFSVFPVFGPKGVVRGEAFWEEVFKQIVKQAATLIVFHHYHSTSLPDPSPLLDRIRRLQTRPVLVATLGDAFTNGIFGRFNIPKPFLALANKADLVCLTSMGVMADHVAKFTRAPIILLPWGVCQVQFSASFVESEQSENQACVVLFVGSRNMSRHPLRGYHWFGRRRASLVESLCKHFGERFRVYGRGWGDLRCSQDAIPFHEQLDVARSATVIVGGIPFSWARYYTSDRPFIHMMSGRPLIDFRLPGVETLLVDRQHWVLSSESEYIETVQSVLEWTEGERNEMGRTARAYVLSRHTLAHRVSTLVENVKRIRGWRNSGYGDEPFLPYFHEGVDLEKERPLVARHWPGS
jgi:hypothetical protein